MNTIIFQPRKTISFHLNNMFFSLPFISFIEYKRYRDWDEEMSQDREVVMAVIASLRECFGFFTVSQQEEEMT